MNRFEPPAPLVPDEVGEQALFAEELKKSPGRWALMGRYPGTPGSARQFSYAIRNGLTSPFTPPGSFEAETHTMFGERRVYVRYTGEREG